MPTAPRPAGPRPTSNRNRKKTDEVRRKPSPFGVMSNAVSEESVEKPKPTVRGSTKSKMDEHDGNDFYGLLKEYGEGKSIFMIIVSIIIGGYLTFFADLQNITALLGIGQGNGPAIKIADEITIDNSENSVNIGSATVGGHMKVTAKGDISGDGGK